MWNAKRRVLKIKSLKHGIIQDKRGNVMRTVFGIDVSKTSSEVAILVNGEKVHGYTILNDAIGFNRLLGDLKTVHNPEIIFEATGVYSRRLQAFLEECGYAYTRLNPLEAKKQLETVCEFVKQIKLTLKSWLNLSLCTIVNQLTCRKKFINTCVI